MGNRPRETAHRPTRAVFWVGPAEGVTNTDPADGPTDDHPGPWCKTGPQRLEQAADPLLMSALEEMLQRAISNGASSEFVVAVRQLVFDEYPDIWRLELGHDPPADVKSFVVVLNDDAATEFKGYRKNWSMLERKFLSNEVEALLQLGIAERSSSPWAHPIVLAKKKDGSFRLCVDLRAINHNTQPDHNPIPKIDELLVHVKGAKFFAVLDLLRGYWQFPVHPDSRKFFGFRSHDRLCQFARVPMGARNAAAHFQQVMQDLLDDLLYIHLLVYLDDVLLFSDSEQGLLSILQAVFKTFHSVGIKVKPSKVQLLCRQVKFCGHVLSAEGHNFDQDQVDTLTRIPLPTTAGQLQSFNAGANWFRSSTPCFAQLIQPLKDVETAALSDVKRKSTAAAAKVLLTPAHGWNEEAKQAFEVLKATLQRNVLMAHRRDDWSLHLLSDASKFGWAAILTQTPPHQEHLPIHLRDHELLRVLSGTFKIDSAEFNRAIPDKEAFSFIMPATRWRDLLLTEEGFHLWTDHRNLVYLFAPDPTKVSVMARERLQRWAIQLSEFKYHIHHIAGGNNFFPDLLSRWGGSAAVIHARVARATVIGERAVSMDVTDSTIDPNTQWPSPGEFECTFDSLPDAERATVEAVCHPDGSILRWRETAQVYVPDVNQLRQRILVIAHAGAAGHRGTRTTLKRIRKRFWWPHCRDDVRTFLQQCLVCCKTVFGSPINRPWGDQLTANAVNEVLAFDFLTLDTGLSDTGEMHYVLVMKDLFSGFTLLRPFHAASSESAATGIIEWCTTFGVVSTWLSDQGSHFKNSVVELLAQYFKADHRFTTPYCAWANGAVERVNSEVLRLLRRLIAENGMSEDQWPLLLPAVQYALNTAPSERLAGHSPLQVFTNLPSHEAIDAILIPPRVDHTDSNKASLQQLSWSETVVNLVTSSRRELDALHVTVRQALARKRLANRKARMEQGKVIPIDFGVGDYVLQYTRVKRSKLQVRWIGPRRVVDCLNPWVFVVEDLVTKTTETVHCCRLVLYADEHLDITTDLKDQIGLDGIGYTPEAIVGHGVSSSGEPFFTIKWLGFEDSETSDELWQPIFEDDPGLVLSYLEQHSAAHSTLAALRDRLSKKGGVV